MNLIWFLIRASWGTVLVAGLSGALAGASKAFVIATINDTVNSNESSTSQFILKFIGLSIAALLAGILSQYLLGRLSQSAIYKLRLRMSGWILACPLRHLEELGANRLLAALTNDIQAISNTIFIIPYLCVDIALILGCLVYLGYLSGLVLLIMLVCLVAIVALFQFLLTKSYRILRLAREEQDQLFKHFRTITEGIKELKLHTHRRETFLAEELQVTAALSCDYNVNSLRIQAIANNVGDFLIFITIGLLVFGLTQLTTIDKAVLSGYVLLLLYLVQPLDNILKALPSLERASIALQKIETLGLSLASRSETVSQTELNSQPFFQKIELKQITHNYSQENEARNFTIGPIDLTLHSSELIFIIGGNGSGKSTLAKLITGLYIPEAGEIILDGNPITEPNRETYRQLFAAIFSDFYLFERMLGINLTDLDIQAKEYLKQLQLEHKVQIKEGKLSTIALSQGQRKRLALLTAYLEDRPIYLFDEWASDQDPFFRDLFYKQLLPELKHRGKTVLVISHDDRYFHVADRLIKLDYGKLVNIDKN